MNQSSAVWNVPLLISASTTHSCTTHHTLPTGGSTCSRQSKGRWGYTRIWNYNIICIHKCALVHHCTAQCSWAPCKL